ncbi:MAG: hypothetical protein ACI8X5_003153 [Planctomycetota bacterium]|jgi:hypothetical protein
MGFAAPRSPATYSARIERPPDERSSTLYDLPSRISMNGASPWIARTPLAFAVSGSLA